MSTDDLTGLVAKAAKYTAHHVRRYDTDPMVPVARERLAVLEATALVRDHFTRRDALSGIAAEPYGVLTLALGTSRIRLEPGTDAHPKRLTDRQAEDLLIIASPGRATLKRMPRTGGLSIACGLHGVIPPAAAERLILRGYVATTGADGAEVEVSAAGTVALTWRFCKLQGITGERCAEQIAEAVHDVYRPEPADTTT